MTTINWASGTSGNFSTGSKWTGGVAPGSSDNAVITATGTYTVTENSGASVSSLTIGTGVTFDVTAGLFSIGAGTSSNVQTIEATSAGSLAINSASLTNSGTIKSTDTAASTISVASLTNTGTISETGGGTLAFVDSRIDNTGSSNLGNITVTGTNSVIEFDASTQQILVSGGTLTASGGGSFEVLGAGGNKGAVFDGTNASVTLSGPLTVDALSNLSLIGSIINKGTITVGAAGDALGDGSISVGSTTLTGAGSIILSDNPTAATALMSGFNNAPDLTNVNNKISGAGTIGFGGPAVTSFTLDNQAAGTINANQAHALDINVSTLTNEGLIEATFAGGLTIEASSFTNSGTIKATAASTSTITAASLVNTGTISETGGGTLAFVDTWTDNTGSSNLGKITVTGTNSVIEFDASTRQILVSGGTLTASSGGSFEVLGTAGNRGAVFDGTTAPVTLSGPLTVDGASNLSLVGSIVNKGTITLEAAGDVLGDGSITVSSTTLTGAGSIILSDNPAGATALVSGYYNAHDLTNVNNNISGAGTIGFGGPGVTSFTLDNQSAGTINANQAHGLDINLSTLTNEGLIEATAAGGLTIEASSFTNTGTITANGGNVVVNSAVTGSGHATIGNTSTLEFTSTSTANTTFLTGSSATLQLDNSAGFTGTITGFGSSNILDLRDFSSTGASVSYASGTGTLTVTNSSTNVSYHMAMVGVSAFQVIDDGHGGTYVISA